MICEFGGLVGVPLQLVCLRNHIMVHLFSTRLYLSPHFFPYSCTHVAGQGMVCNYTREKFNQSIPNAHSKQAAYFKKEIVKWFCNTVFFLGTFNHANLIKRKCLQYGPFKIQKKHKHFVQTNAFIRLRKCSDLSGLLLCPTAITRWRSCFILLV